MKNQIKRIATVVFAALLVLLAIPMVASADTPIYTFSFSDTAMEKELVVHLDNKDAVDAWDMSFIAGLKAGDEVALKSSFNPPRTHMKFEFEVATAGKYYLSIRYYSYPDASDRRVCVEIDNLGKQDISCEDSDARRYLIIPMELTAGKHSFTMYTPMEFNQTVNGATVNSANLTSYDIYSDTDTNVDPAGGYQNGTYTHEYLDRLPDLNGKTVVMDAYNNDAIDSFNPTYVQGLADYAALSLKLTFNPPRTHLTFGFTVETPGLYNVAIEYKAAPNETLRRTVVAQIDSMGKEQFSVQTSDNNYYLVISVELAAGDHTLTVYAPENLDMKDENDRKYQSCDHYAYRAWLAEDSSNTLQMKDGAAVYMSETSALRFASVFSETYYNGLVAEYGADNLEFGMLLMPASYALGMSAISPEALDLISAPYIDYASTLYKSADGSYVFYGVTPVTDNETQYAGIGYIKATKNGEETVLYAEFKTKNVRSVNEVAAAAYADTKAASEEGYTNAVTGVDNATVYSPYSAENYAFLKALLPKNDNE